VEVKTPKGRTVAHDGVASSRDKFFTKGGKTEAREKDIVHKAETAAYNRAIMDLTGVEIGPEEAY